MKKSGGAYCLLRIFRVRIRFMTMRFAARCAGMREWSSRSSSVAVSSSQSSGAAWARVAAIFVVLLSGKSLDAANLSF